MRVTLFGRGGHGSRPETTVDPVVMAAATVLRLQTIVAREVPGSGTAVLYDRHAACGDQGEHHPGPGRARDHPALLRPPRPRADARGASSGSSVPRRRHRAHRREPEIRVFDSFPVTVNDAAGAQRTQPALAGVAPVVDPGLVTGSEDVGLFATEAVAPLVYWLLGGAAPAAFAEASTKEDLLAHVAAQPSNHSPFYAPVVEPTLSIGVAALVAAARRWLPATADAVTAPAVRR